MLREARRLVRPGGNVAMEGMLYADIGSGRFWVGAAESYGVLLGRSGLLP